MGIEKQTLTEGNGVDRPKMGDKVAMIYTGWLQDPNAKDNDFKGAQYVYIRCIVQLVGLSNMS